MMTAEAGTRCLLPLMIVVGRLAVGPPLFRDSTFPLLSVTGCLAGVNKLGLLLDS